MNIDMDESDIEAEYERIANICYEYYMPYSKGIEDNEEIDDV